MRRACRSRWRRAVGDRAPLRFRFVTAIVVAWLSLGNARADDHTVVIENMRFEPQQLTVNAGDRVEWVNKDLVPHSATANDDAFDSSKIDPGQSWSYTAADAGIHGYKCTFHPTMAG